MIPSGGLVALLARLLLLFISGCRLRVVSAREDVRMRDQNSAPSRYGGCDGTTCLGILYFPYCISAL